MRAHWPRSLLSVASLVCLVAAAPFENNAIVRTVELGGSLVHVTTTYAIKALENDVKTYSLALTPEEMEKTSWLEVKLKGQSEVLGVSDGGAADDESYRLLDVSLPKSLNSQDSLNLVVETVQTHATVAWPPTAGQDEDQSLKYTAGLFVRSPYYTKVQRTKVKSPTPRIISFTTPSDIEAYTLESPVTKVGATVTYGPFNDISSTVPQQDIVVHYGYEAPVLEVSRLSRSAEISHWGANLNIQDEIDLRNAGPELKGHFSRLTHQSQSFFHRQAPHILSSLTLHLPSGIRNTYYYDQIGNVSTSRLRVAPTLQTTRKQYSVLEMKPRYPLLGGWKYNFTLGWDAPLSDNGGWDKTKGKYVVEVPIFTEIPGAVIDTAELKIVLPEGATEVEYYEPFPAAATEFEMHTTFLDTTGRPSIVFSYKDLTDKHSKSIYVAYKVSLAAHLKKPIAVATAFLGLFMFTMIARRVNLTIRK